MHHSFLPLTYSMYFPLLFPLCVLADLFCHFLGPRHPAVPSFALFGPCSFDALLTSQRRGGFLFASQFSYSLYGAPLGLYSTFRLAKWYLTNLAFYDSAFFLVCLCFNCFPLAVDLILCLCFLGYLSGCFLSVFVPDEIHSCL